MSPRRRTYTHQTIIKTLAHVKTLRPLASKKTWAKALACLKSKGAPGNGPAAASGRRLHAHPAVVRRGRLGSTPKTGLHASDASRKCFIDCLALRVWGADHSSCDCMLKLTAGAKTAAIGARLRDRLVGVSTSYSEVHVCRSKS